MSGGGSSLLRTLLRVEIPANSENYSEFQKLQPTCMESALKNDVIAMDCQQIP
jgi:hypothetical protein